MKRRTAGLAALLGCVFASCGADAPSPAADAAPASPPVSAPTTAATPTTDVAVVQQECGPAHAEQLRKRYDGICVPPSPFDVTMLAVADWGSTDFEPRGILVRITKDGVSTGGTPQPFEHAGFIALVREESEKAQQMAEGRGEAWLPVWMLDIAKDASMTTVDDVARALIAQKLERGVLLFASKTLRSPPPVEPELYRRFAAEIEGAPPDERATTVARKLETLVATCPSAVEVFGRVAAVPSDDKCATIVRDLSDAFVACGCPSSEAEILTWVQVMAGPADAPFLLAHPQTLAISPAMVRPAAQTWGAFVAAQKAPSPILQVPPPR